MPLTLARWWEVSGRLALTHEGQLYRLPVPADEDGEPEHLDEIGWASYDVTPAERADYARLADLWNDARTFVA